MGDPRCESIVEFKELFAGEKEELTKLLVTDVFGRVRVEAYVGSKDLAAAFREVRIESSVVVGEKKGSHQHVAMFDGSFSG